MTEEKQTKKCPYCVEEIRVEAVKCKHCGSILDKRLKKESNKPKEGPFLQVLNIGCVIFLALIIISVLVLLFS